MIEHVNAGSPLKIRAEDFNLIADAANAFAANDGAPDCPTGAYNRAAGQGAYCLVRLQYDAKYGHALQAGANNLSQPDARADWPAVFTTSYRLSRSTPAYDVVGIAMADGKAGDVIPVCFGGPCIIEVTGASTTSSNRGVNFARPNLADSDAAASGDLIASSWGPLRLIKQYNSSNGNFWIAINGGGPVWNFGGNNVPNAKIYTIDKTQRVSVENKSWNPMTGTPSDWATYDAVELITWTMEYLGGGSWRMAKYSQIWQAPNAPIIGYSTEESTLLTQQRYPNPEQQIVVFNPDTPLT